MVWHIETDIIGLCAACLLLVYQTRMHPDAEEKLRSRGFTTCLWISVIVTAIDILASVIMDFPFSRFLYQLLMTLYLLSVVLIIVSWFAFSLGILFDDNPARKRQALCIAIAPYLAYAVLVCTNPFTGLFFTLDANMVYARGPMFLYMVYLFSLYTITLFVLTLCRHSHISNRYSAKVLLAIPVMLAASIAIQLLNPGWLVIMPTYTLSLLMAFFFLQSKELQEQLQLMHHLSIEASTDPLTGVYNRVGAEDGILRATQSHKHTHCLVLFVDVDDLKIINDQLGHESGDRALVAVAHRMREFFRASDIIERHGGDEFVAYLFGYFTEERIRTWLERLTTQLTNIPFDEDLTHRISASIGAALGAADEHKLLLQYADEALYRVKRSGKNNFELYNHQTIEA